MTNEFQGIVTEVKTNEDGEAWGVTVKGNGGPMRFKYSIPENRKLPWDMHDEGDVVLVKYNPQERNGKVTNWVSSIELCSGPTEPIFGSPEGSPAHEQAKEKKAAVVKEVLAGEQGRNQSIERQVAMKCAAEVVAAIGTIYATSNTKWGNDDLAELIDLCLDKFLAATK